MMGRYVTLLLFIGLAFLRCEKSKTKYSLLTNKKRISKIFSKNHTTFCYCISDYPLVFEKINWKSAIKYDGFSDHTMDIFAPILFTILKKQRKSKKIYIEKHVKMNNSKGPDASTSISTEKFSEMIKLIRIIEKMKI